MKIFLITNKFNVGSYSFLRIIVPPLFFFLISGVNNLQAETIDVFDSNRDNPNQNKSGQKSPNQNKSGQKSGSSTGIKLPKKVINNKKSNKKNHLNFKLIGISKVSNQYIVYFKNKKGKTDKFLWSSKDEVPGGEAIYEHYSIANIVDRKVYLNIKGNKTCIENETQGITCNSVKKQMILELVRSKLKYIPARQAASNQRKRSAMKNNNKAFPGEPRDLKNAKQFPVFNPKKLNNKFPEFK